MNFLAAVLIFVGIVVALVFQARINPVDVAIREVAGFGFGCLLIAVGAGMIAGA